MLENKTYVPTLAVRPSEMKGLEFLPGVTKDRMMPCFLLAPWVNASTLERTITRIDLAFPNRNYIVDIDSDYPISNDASEAQRQLERLRNPTDAFANWVEFVRQHEWIVPCIQTGEQSESEIRRQIEAFRSLGRPYCVRILLQRFPANFDEILKALSAEGAADFAVILEGGWTNDPLTLAARFSGLISEGLQAIDASVAIVLSCTSIPKMFTQFSGDRPISVPFQNRQLLEQVARGTNRQRIIYGDWGSTRPRDERTIASRPLDRIDYPTDRAWLIARNKDASWTFRDAALATVADSRWDENLGIWGEEMIRNTTVNEALGIDTPQKNVASRVNIHLHRQAFFGEPPLNPSAFDEDWQD